MPGRKARAVEFGLENKAKSGSVEISEAAPAGYSEEYAAGSSGTLVHVTEFREAIFPGNLL
jgi:hypothetical protein